MKLLRLFIPPVVFIAIMATTSAQTTSDCGDIDWCVKFKDINTVLGGEAGSNDIKINYHASEPNDDGSTKFYKVSIRDHENCDTPAVSGSGIDFPNNYVGGGIPKTEYTDDNDTSNKAGFITVGFNIDTSIIENSPFSSDVKNNKFDVKFCVKTDLLTTIDSKEIAVDTNKVKLTLTIDKSQTFGSFGIITLDDVITEEEQNVDLNYNLLACVCATGDSDQSANGICLSDYTTLTPGSPFKFCVKSQDSEVKVTALKDVSFKAKDPNKSGASDVVEIVIINTSGEGVGVASDPDCDASTGVCVVSALAYAMLYEYNDGSNIIDISSWARIEGTSILDFTDSAIALPSNSPTVFASHAPSTRMTCNVSGLMTGSEATAACAGKNCCIGTNGSACIWAAKLQVCLADNACNGVNVCRFLNGQTDGAAFNVGPNSCTGSHACYGLTMPSNIGEGSCQGKKACAGTGLFGFNIGDGSCTGAEYMCYHGEGYNGSLTFTVGDGSCLAQSSCARMKGSVGDSSCTGQNACTSKTEDIGDNQYTSRRRLHSTLMNAPGPPNELTMVGFTTSAAAIHRQTQVGTIQVNAFNMTLDLATAVSDDSSTFECGGIGAILKNIIHTFLN